MFQELDDLYGAVGYGGVAAVYVLTRLMDEKRKKEEKQEPKMPPVVQDVNAASQQNNNRGKASHGVYVAGNADMLVRFAKCCNPVPGDDIVGYITRGRGVTVHKADCVNALHTEPERAVNVSWADSDVGTFSSNIQIICYDHPSLLGELVAFFDDVNLPITAMSVKVNKNKTVTITMTVNVTSREQLDNALRKLHRRSDIIEAYRSNA